MIRERLAQYAATLGFIFVVILPSLLLSIAVTIRDVIASCCCCSGRPPAVDPESEPPKVAATDSSVDMKGVPPNARPILTAAVKSVTANGSSTIGNSTTTKLSWVEAGSDPRHLAGLPRRFVLSCVGSFAVMLTTVMNRVKVRNRERLIELMQNRPAGTPLVTCSNHMSTLDDPLMWGVWSLRASDPRICRWTLTAKDICFTNDVMSYFFRLGKCIPIDRFGTIHQPCMAEAIQLINQGEWLHTFPEGKVMQDHLPLTRLKWGVASVIARSDVNPIVLPIAHSGFEKVMPEKHLFGRRALFPLWGKSVSIVVGEPFQFDLVALRREAEEAVASGDPEFGKDTLQPLGGDEEEGGNGAEGGGKGGGGDVNAVVKEGAMTREEREAKVLGVGDEATRRLYSEMTDRIRKKLQACVLEAHRDAVARQ